MIYACFHLLIHLLRCFSEWFGWWPLLPPSCNPLWLHVQMYMLCVCFIFLAGISTATIYLVENGNGRGRDPITEM